MRFPIALLLAIAPLSGCSTPPPPPPPTPPTLEDRAGQQPLVLELIDASLAAVQSDPTSAGAWRDLGIAYHANRLIDLAAPCYQYTLAVEPDDARTAYFLALILAELGDTTTALSQVKMLATTPDMPAGVASTQGRWHLQAGELDEAWEAFGRDLNLDPTKAASIVGLARCAIAAGDEATALKALEPLYNNPSTPNRPWIAHLLAQCHQHAGRTAEADAIRPTGPLPSAHWPNDWTDELWNHRRDAEWLIQRAHERILARNPSAALAILAPLAPYYATDPAYLKMMGMAYFTQGDIDLAISYMEDVTQNSPDDAAAAMNLGFAYAKAGDLRAAQEATRRAVAIDPTNDAAAEQLVHIENALRNRGETP